MKQYLPIVLLALTLTGCMGCTRVSPGHVGLKSTLTGTGRGMSDVAVGPAWVTYNPITEDIIEYPIFVQTAVWTASKDEGKPHNEEITFTIKGSMQMASDMSLAYSLSPEKSPAFFLKFRAKDLDTFTHGFLRNLAREKFDTFGGKYEVDQVMGDNAAFLKEVREALQKDLDPYGVKIEQFGFIGAPRAPESVKASINLKMQASQIAMQKQNEVTQAEADAKKEIAKADGDAKARRLRADAEAEANLKIAASLTPSLVEYQKIMKWDGKLSTYSGIGGGGIILNTK